MLCAPNDHPERFARYYAKRAPCNLGKPSGQPAEANHSSIVARLGPGSTQGVVIQITDLLSRQAELNNANTIADAKYKLLSAKLAREAEAQNKPEEAKALRALSSLGREGCWK